MNTYYAVTGDKCSTAPTNYKTREHAEAARAFNSHEYPSIGPWRVIELRQVAKAPDTDPGFDAFRAELTDKDELLMRGQYLAERELEADYEAWLYFDWYMKEVAPPRMDVAA